MALTFSGSQFKNQYEFVLDKAKKSRFFDSSRYQSEAAAGHGESYINAMAMIDDMTPRDWDEGFYNSLRDDRDAQYVYLLNQYFEEDDETYTKTQNALQNAAEAMIADRAYESESGAEKFFKTAGASIGSFFGSIGAFAVDGVLGLLNVLSGGELNKALDGYSAMQDFEQSIRKDLYENNTEFDLKYTGFDLEGNVGYESRRPALEAYQSVVNGVATVVPALIPVVGQGVYGSLMFGNIVQGTITSEEYASASTEQKIALLASGIFTEMLPEFIFKGGVMKAGLVNISGKIGAKVGQIVSTHSSAKVAKLFSEFAHVIASGAEEGIEEMLSEVLQTGFESVILNDKWKWSDPKEVMLAGITGAISAFVMTGGRIMQMPRQTIRTASGDVQLSRFDSYLLNESLNDAKVNRSSNQTIFDSIIRDTEVAKQAAVRDLTVDEFRAQYSSEYAKAARADRRSAVALGNAILVLEGAIDTLGKDYFPTALQRAGMSLDERATAIKNFVNFNQEARTANEEKFAKANPGMAIKIVDDTAATSALTRNLSNLFGKPVRLVDVGGVDGKTIDGIMEFDGYVYVNRAYLENNKPSAILSTIISQERVTETLTKWIEVSHKKDWQKWSRDVAEIKNIGVAPWDRNAVEISNSEKAQLLLFSDIGIRNVVRVNRRLAAAVRLKLPAIIEAIKSLRTKNSNDVATPILDKMLQYLYIAQWRYNSAIADELTRHFTSEEVRNNIVTTESIRKKIQEQQATEGVQESDVQTTTTTPETPARTPKIDQAAPRDVQSVPIKIEASDITNDVVINEYAKIPYSDSVAAALTKEIKDNLRMYTLSTDTDDFGSEGSYRTTFLDSLSEMYKSQTDFIDRLNAYIGDNFCDAAYNPETKTFVYNKIQYTSPDKTTLRVVLKNTVRQKTFEEIKKLSEDTPAIFKLSQFIDASMLKALSTSSQDLSSVPVQIINGQRAPFELYLQGDGKFMKSLASASKEKAEKMAKEKIVAMAKTGHFPVHQDIITRLIAAARQGLDFHAIFLFNRYYEGSNDALVDIYHAARHVVQNAFGMNSGTSPMIIADAIQSQLDDVSLESNLPTITMDTLDTFAQNVIRDHSALIQNGYLPKSLIGETRWKRYREEWSKYSETEKVRIVSQFVYYMTLGEMEARDVTAKLNPTQRMYFYWQVTPSGSLHLSSNDAMKAYGLDIQLPMKSRKERVSYEFDDRSLSFLTEIPGLADTVTTMWSEYYNKDVEKIIGFQTDNISLEDKIIHILSRESSVGVMYLRYPQVVADLYEKLTEITTTKGQYTEFQESYAEDLITMIEDAVGQFSILSSESPRTVTTKANLWTYNDMFSHASESKLPILASDADSFAVYAASYELSMASDSNFSLNDYMWSIPSIYTQDFRDRVKYVLENAPSNEYGITHLDYLENNWTHTLNSYLTLMYGVAIFRGKFMRLTPFKFKTTVSDIVAEMAKDETMVSETYKLTDIIETSGLPNDVVSAMNKVYVEFNRKTNNNALGLFSMNIDSKGQLVGTMVIYESDLTNSFDPFSMTSTFIHEAQHAIDTIINKELTVPERGIFDALKRYVLDSSINDKSMRERIDTIVNTVKDAYEDIGYDTDFLQRDIRALSTFTKADTNKVESLLRAYAGDLYYLMGTEQFAFSARGIPFVSGRQGVSFKYNEKTNVIDVATFGEFSKGELKQFIEELRKEAVDIFTGTGYTGGSKNVSEGDIAFYASNKTRAQRDKDVSYHLYADLDLKLTTYDKLVDYGFTPEFAEAMVESDFYMTNGEIKSFIYFNKLGNTDAMYLVCSLLYPDNKVDDAGDGSFADNLENLKMWMPVLATLPLDANKDKVYTFDDAQRILVDYYTNSQRKADQYSEYSSLVLNTYPNIWLLSQTEPLMTPAMAHEFVKRCRSGFTADLKTIQNEVTDDAGRSTALTDVLGYSTESAEDQVIAAEESVVGKDSVMNDVDPEKMTVDEFIAQLTSRLVDLSDRERIRQVDKYRTRKGSTELEKLFGSEGRKKIIKALAGEKRQAQYYINDINRYKRFMRENGIDFSQLPPYSLDLPYDELVAIAGQYKTAYEVARKNVEIKKAMGVKASLKERKNIIMRHVNAASTLADRITVKYGFTTVEDMVEAGFDRYLAELYFAEKLDSKAVEQAIVEDRIGNTNAWNFVIEGFENPTITTKRDLVDAKDFIAQYAAFSTFAPREVDLEITDDIYEVAITSLDTTAFDVFKEMIDSDKMFYIDLLKSEPIDTIRKARKFLTKINSRVKDEAAAKILKSMSVAQNNADRGIDIPQTAAEAQVVLDSESVPDGDAGFDDINSVAATDTPVTPENVVLAKQAVATLYRQVSAFTKDEDSRMRVSKQFARAFGDTLSQMNDSMTQKYVTYIKDRLTRLTGEPVRNIVYSLEMIRDANKVISKPVKRKVNTLLNRMISVAGKTLAAATANFKKDIALSAIIEEAKDQGYTIPEDLISRYAAAEESQDYNAMIEINKEILIVVAKQIHGDVWKDMLHGTWDQRKRAFYTVVRKINSFRYMSMLSRPSTHANNLVSNAAIRGLNAVTERFAQLIEPAISKSLGLNEIRLGKRGQVSEDVRKLVNDRLVANGRLKFIMSGSKYMNAENLAQHAMDAMPFKNKTMNKIHNFIFGALEKGDNMFVYPEVIARLEQYLTANFESVNQITDEHFESFLQIALSDAMELYMRQPNRATKMIAQMVENHPFLEFLMGAILPFPKVVMNMTMKLYRATPFGLISILRDLIKYKVNSKMITKLVDEEVAVIDEEGSIQIRTQKVERQVMRGPVDEWANIKIARAASECITGSAILTIGVILAAAGILDYDEDMYGIVIKIGDFKVTVDAFAPAFSPLMVGAVLLSETTKDEGRLATIWDEIGQLSVFATIDSLFTFNDNLPELMVSSLGNYFLQFVPAVLKGIARIIDPGKKEYKGNPLYRLAAAIPGFTSAFPNVIPDKINPYTGEAYNLNATNRWSAFTSLLFPFDWSWDHSTDFELEVKRLGKESQGATGRFTINGVDYSLSGIEKEEYARTRGQVINKLGNQLIKSSKYLNATDEERRDMISSLYNSATLYTKVNYWITKKNGKYVFTSRDDYREYIGLFGSSSKYRYRDYHEGTKFI